MILSLQTFGAPNSALAITQKQISDGYDILNLLLDEKRVVVLFIYLVVIQIQIRFEEK